MRAAIGAPIANRSTTQREPPLSFGINPPFDTTTERAAAGYPLSNKTTSPIHHDMNRAPSTTFAGSPYNAQRFRSGRSNSG